MSYMDIDRIIGHYNHAIDNFNKALVLKDTLGKFDKVEELLKNAADSLYEVIEWSFKRHLNLFWDKQFKESSISNIQHTLNINNLSTSKADIGFLIKEMKQHANPDIMTVPPFEYRPKLEISLSNTGFN